MNHADHVALIREGVPRPGGVWADLGSGRGAFTLALAELIGAAGEIYSVDRDRNALREQERAMRAQFAAMAVHYLAADFTRPLNLPPLDGLVMANSLHFLRDKEPAVRLIRSYLKPGGRLIVVEYNVEQGNFAVPYPLSFSAWEALAHRSGFVKTRLLMTRPSRFLEEIFSAVSG